MLWRKVRIIIILCMDHDPHKNELLLIIGTAEPSESPRDGIPSEASQIVVQDYNGNRGNGFI